MEDLYRFNLANKIAHENLLAAAKEARLARMARPTPSRRLGILIAATAILLGMVLMFAL